MNKTALARPNLKGIFFGALLLAMVVQLFSGSPADGPKWRGRAQLDSSKLEKYLDTLLEQAARTPDPDLLTLISTVYEQKKDFRKALFFLREADRLTVWADN